MLTQATAPLQAEAPRRQQGCRAHPAVNRCTPAEMAFGALFLTSPRPSRSDLPRRLPVRRQMHHHREHRLPLGRHAQHDGVRECGLRGRTSTRIRSRRRVALHRLAGGAGLPRDQGDAGRQQGPVAQLLAPRRETRGQAARRPSFSAAPGAPWGPSGASSAPAAARTSGSTRRSPSTSGVFQGGLEATRRSASLRGRTSRTTCGVWGARAASRRSRPGQPAAARRGRRAPAAAARRGRLDGGVARPALRPHPDLTAAPRGGGGGGAPPPARLRAAASRTGAPTPRSTVIPRCTCEVAAAPRPVRRRRHRPERRARRGARGRAGGVLGLCAVLGDVVGAHGAAALRGDARRARAVPLGDRRRAVGARRRHQDDR